MVFQVYADELELYNSVEVPPSRTTYHAGKTLIDFAVNIKTRVKTKLKTNRKLNLQLIKLGQSLLYRKKPQIIKEQGEKLFKFFIEQEAFDL